jgi:O-antigen/teichoic acid export membrane protein
VSAPAGRPLAHLRRLFAHSAVYGLADVFTSVVNFLLLPVYTARLTATEYGHLALLLLFSTLAKILFRLGLDAGFFRLYYEQDDERQRRRLAGSVAVFAALAGAALFALVALLAGPLTRALLGAQAPRSWVVLVAADVYLGTFAFVPLSLLRIEERPGLFSAFSAGRHAANAALKVGLLVAGYGVAGVLWSDLLATGLFVAGLLPRLRGRAALTLSPPLLREALAFGLPKVPHGLLLQLQNLADRKILDLFASRAEVGLYHVGYTFGQGVKFALSAFEPAWGPFVYAEVRKEGAPRTLARVATPAFAVFLAAGLAVAVLGRELLTLMTPRSPEYRAAAPVIPVVALAYVLHGVFLLTSVGIGIAREARYYPLITAATATVNIAGNLLLVPRLGMMGAAWATVLSYAVMAGLGFVLSRRLYPIPFETARLLRLTAAGGLAWALSCFAPLALGPALAFKAAVLLGFAAVTVLDVRHGLRAAEVSTP